jgi:separase
MAECDTAIAMPMGNRDVQQRDRQSTRLNIQAILERSERAFLSLLETASNRARVEDVRVACQSLALLRAFKTSLGQGSDAVTGSAASVLGKPSFEENQRN